MENLNINAETIRKKIADKQLSLINDVIENIPVENFIEELNHRPIIERRDWEGYFKKIGILNEVFETIFETKGLYVEFLEKGIYISLYPAEDEILEKYPWEKVKEVRKKYINKIYQIAEAYLDENDVERLYLKEEEIFSAVKKDYILKKQKSAIDRMARKMYDEEKFEYHKYWLICDLLPESIEYAKNLGFEIKVECYSGIAIGITLKIPA